MDINIDKLSKDIYEKYKDNIINCDSDTFEGNDIFDDIEYEKNSKKYFIGSVYYYLFDGYLNKNIGSSQRVRDYFFSTYKLFDLLNIQQYNKVDIHYGVHSTIFYKIINQERFYIYYSNSGKGINNQITINDITHSKIYNIDGVSEDEFNKIFNFITSYIDTILYSFNQYDIYKYYTQLNQMIDKLIKKYFDPSLMDTYKKMFNLTYIDYFILNKIINIVDKLDLCYDILDFISYKFDRIKKCSFNHIISGYDDTDYIDCISIFKKKRPIPKEKEDKIRNMIDKYISTFVIKSTDDEKTKLQKLEKDELSNFDKIDLMCFCSSFPDIKSILSKLDDSTPITISTKSSINEFHDFIVKFNEKLDNLIRDNPNRTTLSFIRKRFKLVHKYKSGLYNNIQQSGSCTFYSLYNLGINMTALGIFNNIQLDTIEKKANELLNVFLTFHYTMLVFFCKSNDVLKINGFNNNFFNIYIYHIITKNDLLTEINEFYKDSTFMLNLGKPAIDKLLDNTNLTLKVLPDLKPPIKLNINDFTPLYKLLDDILYKIRQKKEIKWSNELESLRRLFKNINQTIIISDVGKNLYISYKTRLKLFYDVIPEIYIANLITLQKSYTIKYDLSQDFIDKKKTEISDLKKKDDTHLPKKIIRIFKFYEPKNMDSSISNTNCNERWIENNGNPQPEEINPVLYHGYTKFKNDYLFSRLNDTELCNITYILDNNINELNEIIQENKEIQFKFCKYIKSYKNSDFSIQSDYNFHNIINRGYNLCMDNYYNFNAMITSLNEFIKQMFINYYKINQLINNIYIKEDVRIELQKNKDRIKNNIKNIFINNNFDDNFDDTHISKSEELEIEFVCYLSLIFTNNEYLIFSKNINYGDYLNNFILLSHEINYNTNIYIPDTFKIKRSDFKKVIITQLIRPLIFNNNINPLLDYFGIIEIPIWIKEFGFTKLPSSNKFIKNYIEYKIYNIDINNVECFKIIDILKRFGISYKDKDEYLLLFHIIPELENEILIYEKNILYILIKKFKKCIKITINYDYDDDFYRNGYFFNKVECFISDLINPTEEYQLLFDLNPYEYPFIKLIPNMAPYLCYKKNNEYNINIILSSAWIRNNDGIISYEMFDEDFQNRIMYNSKENNNFFNLFTMVISPSLIFPKTKSFNLKDYTFLCKYYYHDIIDLSSNPSNNLFLKTQLEPIHLPTYIPRIEQILESINKRELYFNPILSTEKDDDLFREIFNSTDKESEKKEKTFQNFINDNRLCNILKCDQECKESLTRPIEKLKRILDEVKYKIEDKIEDFIIDNVEYFILIMELNILINALNDIKKPDINCWDIQEILIKFKTIEYFNKQILQTEFYYGFELLFLLQNEYFFKETQMQKYEEIRNDYSGDQPNSSLKLHQFMMGKGKTSVFTPLLAFGIKILKDKQPTIITLNHLKNQTWENLNFIELITNIKINIFSDFEAKKRWIENTDQFNNLKKEDNINLKDEWNIIDEFDSHHNYLQSMFNYVKGSQVIKRDLFDYVYEFTNKKILDPSYNGDPTKKLSEINIELLNINLNNTFNESKNMVYNEKYGFAFLKLNDEDIKNIRICTPFVRKDTPVKNSDFSNILLRLILTFKIYIEKYNRQLNDELFDIENLVRNKPIINKIINVLPFQLQIDITNELELEEVKIENIKKILYQFYLLKETSNELKDNFLKDYLWNINKDKLKETQTQVNLSFQDIIYNSYEQWQVGYTGTISMDLNKYDDSENFVFKEKIEDFDEIIEVKLALKGYGSPNIYDESTPPKLIEIYDNTVKIILDNIDVDAKIKEIIDLTNKYTRYTIEPRGLIDLAGIFLDYENKTIAEKIYNKLPLKKIIYFGKNDKALEYNIDNSEIEHTPKHNDNFYYYDQCHTVGSDLKQPNIGHIVIIINKYTKYTDFAQAIFRFRKLNRGTFMSIIFIKNITDTITYPDPITNDYILNNILNINEKIFNKNQLDGIKYQLMKAMIRKDSKNYLESELFPEYKNKTKFTYEDIISRMCTNIRNLTNEDLDPLKNIKPENIDKIKSLYDSLIIKEKEEKLKELIIGSGNEKVSEQSQDQVQQQNQQENIDQQTNVGRDSKDYIEIRVVEEKIIKHLNCNQCKLDNCIKLFSTYNIQINNKQIYISINLLSNIYDYYEFKITRLCFIELNDYILIEIEKVGLEYYIDKLPVYDYLGNLMNSYFFNNKNKLDIDPIFISIFGIRYNFEKLKMTKISDAEIKKNIDNMTENAKILLYYYNDKIAKDKYIYNISDYFYDYWTEIKDKIKSILSTKNFSRPYYILDHNLDDKDNISNKNLNIFEDRIKFDENGYDRPVISEVYPLHVIESLTYTDKNRLNDISNKEKYINYKIIDLSYCSNYINENKLSIENKDHSKLKDEIKKLLT